MSEGKVLTCPNCGCEEFMAPAAAHDFFRIVDGEEEIIGSESHDGGTGELTCAECGEDAPLDDKEKERIARALKCSHCGCAEFYTQTASRDVMRIVDGKTEHVRNEYCNPNMKSFFCLRCDKPMPPINGAERAN